MKKIILFLALLISGNSFAQLNYNWGDITNGDANGDDRPMKSICVNNCLYVVGTNNNGSPLGEDIIIKRYDDVGNSMKITYHYPESFNDRARDIAVDPADGSIYVLGITRTMDFGSGLQMIVLKYSSGASLLWQNIIPLPHMEASSLILDGSGGCYAFGKYSTSGTENAIVRKINAIGETEWDNYLTAPPNSAGSMKTKNLVIEGNTLYTTYEYQNSGYHTRINKYNLAGDFAWQLDVDTNFVGVKTVTDDSQNLYVAGYKYGFTNNPKYVKIAPGGTITYTREYPMAGQYNDIQIDEYNKIFVTGNLNYDKIITLKFGDDFTPLWENVFSRFQMSTNSFVSSSLTPNSILVTASLYNNTGMYSKIFTLMINDVSGTVNYIDSSYTSVFPNANLAAGMCNDNVGNCYNVYWANYGTTQEWLVSGFHYPLYIIARPVTIPGLYDFTLTDPRPGDAGAGAIASLNITSLTGSGDISVNFSAIEPLNVTYAGSAPMGSSSYSWFIEKDDAITAINSEVRFDYTQIENSGIADPTNVKIFQRSASGTGDFTELPTTVVGNEIRATVTSFGEFMLGSNDQPLPVELSSFVSTVTGNSVDLKWSTANENNNRGFAIERKTANTQYSEVAFVNGNGTVTTASNYSFNDNNLTAGLYQYRLKQVDFNGNFKYYNLSNEVNIGTPVKYSLSQNYPNPFNPSTKINFELPKEGFVSLKVYDMTGREVYNLVNDIKSAGFHSVSFDGAKLSSGMYFYKISAGEFVSIKKMTLIK